MSYVPHHYALLHRTLRLSAFLLLLLTAPNVRAQPASDWSRLQNYASIIGIDSLCAQPDSVCLTRYFGEIIYGRPPARLSYRGVPETIDSVRLTRLTRQFLAGADWCPLLDSLESPDPAYRGLREYCTRCLMDDYMGDSLTIEQIFATLNTYRWLNRFAGPQRIVINIPSATLRLIDARGMTRLHSRVVVGAPTTPTPGMTALIPGLVLYPYWNVPRSITVRELLPKIRRNPVAVLNSLNMQVIDRSGRVVNPDRVNWSDRSFPYRLRQSTGCDNALGLLKFEVNSPFAIYLHDTNARQVFGRDSRFLSHGCIRVEKPAALANLLLGYVRFKPDYLTTCPVNAQPRTLPLPHPVPVLITYNIIDVDEQGGIQVYKDVYGLWRGKR
ncbi:MAG: L,D-transpeptidase family protein [Spirosoma sp.]|nr:L,D-transpeptidase family protein [Spirosoma sp.]